MLSLCALAGASAQADYTATVDPSVHYQTWDGWGTSLAWWAHVVGGMPDSYRNDVSQKIFGYLGINVVRYNIGGGDDPSHHHIEYRAAVPGYLDSLGAWHWDADPEQRWILQKAKSLGANRFEAFSNAPPYYMTVSGCAAGGQNGDNNLDPNKVQAFASYLAEVTKHFHDSWGITFETLEPLNEPTANWWVYGGRQEGCRIDKGQRQIDLINAVGQNLASRGLSTKVSASDENGIDLEVSSWDSLSADAKAYVSRINTHAYWGSAQHWLNHRAVRDYKRLWMSEYGDGDPTGMTMSAQILRDLRQMMPTAWVYWQAIDQAPAGWGFLDQDLNGRQPAYVINRKYYVFGNYSRYIRPGAKFISIGDANSVAAISGNNLVIVTTNAGGDQTVTFDLTKFDSRAAVATAFRTSATESLTPLANLPVKAGLVKAFLPGKSVTTFVIRNCTYAGNAFDGFYRLRSSRTQYALDDPAGSWTEGQWMTTWYPNDGTNQQWRVEWSGDGFYKFCNRESGLYAAIDNGNAYLPLLQWEDNGDWTAQWSINSVGNGLWAIGSRKRLLNNENSVLDENPNKGNGWPDVVSYPWYAGAEQKWWFDWRYPLYPNL